MSDLKRRSYTSVVVNKFFPSTKLCPECGILNTPSLNDRIYICDCGNIIDRDRNSSINIMSKFLSQNGLWTSYQNFIGNLRQTGIAVIAIYSQEATSSKPKVLGCV